jgi:hypothetical protein
MRKVIVVENFQKFFGTDFRERAKIGAVAVSCWYGGRYLTDYRNIRASNSNRSGRLSWIFENSGCAGFNRIFQSPRMEADGTNRATVSPL